MCKTEKLEIKNFKRDDSRVIIDRVIPFLEKSIEKEKPELLKQMEASLGAVKKIVERKPLRERLRAVTLVNRMMFCAGF